MTTGYKIYNQSDPYFLTFQVIDWVDIFTRRCYCDIILASFDFCRKKKGLEIWAYVIMSNHVHCILSSRMNDLSNIVRDFKSHTAKQILNEIQNAKESRRQWLLKRFKIAANKHKRNSNFQFWTHENHAIELDSREILCQKMAYIHENPIRAGYVEKCEDWLYSSQRNYCDMKALIEIDVMDI